MNSMTNILTLSELCQLGRKVTLPAALEIQNQADTALCTEVLRFVAGKRIVLKAQYQGRAVLLKVFFHSAHKRHIKREVNGAEAFLHAQVNAPAIIFTRVGKDCSLLMYQWLENVVSLQQCWDQAENDQLRNSLVKQVIKKIARLHQAGVEQVDIHLENFLLQDNDKLYAIDGDLVKNKYQLQSKAVPLSIAINNLAMFFTQFPAIYDEYLGQFLQEYLQARQLDDNTITLFALEKRLLELRKWREKKYVYSKALRTCSEFVCQQHWRQKIVFRRDSESKALMTLLADPEAYIYSEQGEILKQGTSTVVAKVKVLDEVFVIKKYKTKNKLHLLLRSLKPTRAEVSWINGCLLQFVKIPTAKPLAILEKRWLFFRGESYIVTEYVNGRHLWAFFHDENNEKKIQFMLLTILQLFKSLYRYQISHGDLKMQNILVREGQLVLVDLDAMQSFNDYKKYQKAFSKDCDRFIRSWDSVAKFDFFIQELNKIDQRYDEGAR